MSDLISRSELYMNDLIRRKDVLALFPTNDCSDKMVGLYERVLDIPIAYDVEKVVEQLEEKTESLKDCTKYGNESAEQQEKSYSTMMMYEVADLVDDLIDIVRNVGKDSAK